MLSDDALLDSIKEMHCWHNSFFMEGDPLGRGETGSGLNSFSSCSAYKGLFSDMFYSVTKSIGARCFCPVLTV